MNKIELLDEKAETIEEKMKAGPIISMSFFCFFLKKIHKI